MGFAMIPKSDTKPTKPSTIQTQRKEKSIAAVTIDTTSKSSKKRKRTIQKNPEEQETKQIVAPKNQTKEPKKQVKVPKQEQGHALQEESEDDDADLLAAARVWADDATDHDAKGINRIASTTKSNKQQAIEESTIEDADKIYSLHITQLSYDANEYEIRTMFSEAGCLIHSIRLVYDGIGAERTFRGVAFLDVCDYESYKKALSLNRRMLLGRKMNVRPTKTKDELTDIVARTKEIVAAKIQRQKDIQDGKENPDSDKRVDKNGQTRVDKNGKTRVDKKDTRRTDKKDTRRIDKKDTKKFDKKDTKKFDENVKKPFTQAKEKRKSEGASDVMLPNKKAKVMIEKSNATKETGSGEPKRNSTKRSVSQEKNTSSMRKPNTNKSGQINTKGSGGDGVPKLTKQERNRKAAILMAKRRGK